MKFTALGGAREIGASAYLLETDGKHILIDAGVRVLPKPGQSDLPKLDLIEKLDLVLVTHSHLDHIGALPVVTKMFPNVKVICTETTYRIIRVMLANNIRVMEEGRGSGSTPLYTEEEFKKLLRNIFLVPFEKWFTPFPDRRTKVLFQEAGHIKGAASILMDTEEIRVFVSGDFSLTDQKTVRGMHDFSFRPDILITEGTYGSEVHPSRREEEQDLLHEVKEVTNGGGVVLIPSFAVGRAQEIILILKDFQLKGFLPQFPIYVDGLVEPICRLYEEIEGSPIFSSFSQIRWGRSYGKNFTVKGPACVVASSGTLKGGASVRYAKQLVGDERNAIFFPGYQDEESPGRKLLELERGGEIFLDGTAFTVRSRVRRYKFSAHADEIQLKFFVSKLSPKVAILVHGAYRALNHLAHALEIPVVWKPGNGLSFDPFEKDLKVYQDNNEVLVHLEGKQ